MSNDKDVFKLEKRNYEAIQNLSREERGDLLLAIYQYQIEGEVKVSLSSACNIVFFYIKNAFDIEDEKQRKICERNRINGSKGGRPPKTEKTQSVFSGNNNYVVHSNTLELCKDLILNKQTNKQTNYTPSISPSFEEKSKKEKIDLSMTDAEITRVEDYESYLESDEYKLFSIVCAKLRENGIEKDLLNEANDFIAYNELRGWQGRYGESVITHLSVYISRWVTKKEKRASK